MNINYERIFPIDLSKYITKEKLGEIKKEANTRRNELLKGRKYGKEYLNNSAIEFAYIYCQNQNKTDVEKALLAANIVIDDEKMAKILESCELDEGILNSYLIILNYLKAKSINDTITAKDAVYAQKAEIITRKISNAVTKYMGPANTSIIINKVAELMSFNKGLILSKTEIAINNLKTYLQTELSKVTDLRYVYYTTEKEDNIDVLKCNFILYCNNIDASDLIKLASIIEVMKAEFKRKHISNNISLSSVKNFQESDDVKYLYYRNNSKVKIKKA